MKKFLLRVWLCIWFIPAVSLLWLAGFILGVANLQNPIETANYIVRTT